MADIEGIYEDLETDVSLEEFREAVEAKVEQMGGLADEETAAMLIAHELGEQRVSGIADIDPQMGEVAFLGKVTSVGDVRTFERDDDEPEGHVCNLEVADESGAVRVALWDEHATAAAEELEAGQVLRIQGRPKEGPTGLEVSAMEVEPDEDADIAVETDGTVQIEALTLGRSDVSVVGQVLATDPVRTFERDDDSEGKVANCTIGDETGRIRVTMWDDRADDVEDLESGETVEVVDGYVREREGDLELHVGDRGAIESVEDEVTYEPAATPIAECELEDVVDLAGVVRSADPTRTFDRDDGTEGQVKNVRIQDDSGDVRVALWGEHADVDVGPGDRVALTDVEIQEGWQDDIEGSAGWRSTVTVLDDGGSVSPPPSAEEATGLDAFGGEETPSAPTEDEEDGEPEEFTGVVVQAGNPVVLDNGEETLSVETDADVGLGEEVTVRGVRRGDRLEATDVF